MPALLARRDGIHREIERETRACRALLPARTRNPRLLYRPAMLTQSKHVPMGALDPRLG